MNSIDQFTKLELFRGEKPSPCKLCGEVPGLWERTNEHGVMKAFCCSIADKEFEDECKQSDGYWRATRKGALAAWERWNGLKPQQPLFRTCPACFGDGDIIGINYWGVCATCKGTGKLT